MTAKTWSFAAVLTLALVACRARAPSASAVVAPPAPQPVGDEQVEAVGPPLGGGVALADFAGRRRAIVADEEARALQVVDVGERRVASTIPLDAEPGQVLLATDGTLFVTLRSAARVVALRFRKDGTTREVARHVTASEPWGLATSPDETTILVTTIAEPGLQTFAAGDLAPGFATPLPRDPRAVAVTPDGARAFVTHATGSLLSVVTLVDGRARRVELDVIEIQQERKTPFKPMASDVMLMRSAKDAMRRNPTGRTANQGFALAIDGSELLLPETLVMTGPTDVIPTGYGATTRSPLDTHVPYLGRVKLDEEKLANDSIAPVSSTCFQRKAECIVPRAAVEEDGKLFVACADSDEILVLDPSRDAEHAPACTAVLADRERISVASPTALAASGRAVYAFSSITRTLTIARTDGAAPVAIAMPGETADALGRRLFHRGGDPRIAKNGRACASCHVDGRDDGLVWPTPRGKRQTPMLAGRVAGTAPYGWNGEHPTLESHIASTLKNLEGTGLPHDQLASLARYVEHMHAATVASGTDAAVARGKAIFLSEDAGCASCHIEGTKLTDGETHALLPTREAFATPSLAFVGRTAPYFHDGRFETLDALVGGCDDASTKMGHTSHLDGADRRALVAYLRTL